MKHILLIIVTALAHTITMAQEKNFIDQNFIEVTGKAELEVAADLIHIRIFLSEKDSKSKAPLADRENMMISKLKEIGIDVDKDLAVQDMLSNFRYYLLAKSDILLSKTYDLVVHDGKTAATVFVELEKIGISGLSIEKLDNSQIDKHKREVKVAAIKAAKEKAEALASAIGQGAGRAIYVQELDNSYGVTGNSGNVVIRGYTTVKRAQGYASEPVSVEFEKIRLEYSILCRFELK